MSFGQRLLHLSITYMELNQIILPEHILPDLRVSCKKQALQQLSAYAAPLADLDEADVFDALMQREKLGSTGVGGGIAIPHARINGLDKIIGVFARLSAPVEFDSVDDAPVDLICLLLTGEDAGANHLKALARVSRLLRDGEICTRLRGASNAETMFSLMASPTANAA